MPPILPNELIARILSCAAAQVRQAVARPFDPVPAFLRTLALLSKAWRNFGQSELLREVQIFCPGDEYDPFAHEHAQGYRLIVTLAGRPHLAELVKAVIMVGGEHHPSCWHRLFALCTRIERVALYGCRLSLDSLAELKGASLGGGGCSWASGS